MSFLVDSHCHLDFPGLAERLPEVLANMDALGVGWALCIGVTLEDFPKVLTVARSDDRLWASVGVHPDHEGGEEPTLERLVELAADSKVIGIGETGLDYYRLTDRPEWQRERFRTHLRAARACGKPVIVHTRAAAEDTLMILREEGAEAVGGVMHCFTESLEVARAALDLGMYISFSGILTFKNAAALREVAAYVPEDRILVETDAPYLAPVPHRGKTNEPAYVRFVAECLAQVRGVSFERIAERTTENFFRLFFGTKNSAQ
ncbi:TatD family hydrolase [Tepidiphilus sp. J10]|uniref:TatD family hydrolase n=1 Tax=Tepidiphilus sp. J10 TaxID=2502185 RepID=UPI00115CB86C|nr:TatD family hydrolase [Tepidiphilus sp. J10]